MQNDIYSAYACSIGALATLKSKTPASVSVKNELGELIKRQLEYQKSSDVIYCICDGFKAYATADEHDFSIIFDNNVFCLSEKTKELYKLVLSGAAKIMSNIPGAQLHLSLDEENINEGIPFTE